MSRLSNYLKTYSVHGRRCFMIALGELFVSVLMVFGSIGNLIMIGGQNDLASILFWLLLLLGFIISIFSIVLQIGVRYKSAVHLNIWLMTNLGFICLGGLAAIFMTCAFPPFFGFAILIALCAIQRSTQWWKVKEFHWEILDRKISEMKPQPDANPFLIANMEHNISCNPSGSIL